METEATEADRSLSDPENLKVQDGRFYQYINASVRVPFLHRRVVDLLYQVASHRYEIQSSEEVHEIKGGVDGFDLNGLHRASFLGTLVEKENVEEDENTQQTTTMVS